MYSLIAFATGWGSKHGGINSFNADFLQAFGAAYYNCAQVICIVTEASEAEKKEAANKYVTLVPLRYPPQGKTFSTEQAQAGIDELNRRSIRFDPGRTVWLGHDRITGAAAIEAARITGSRSALIHHMSYDHYESFAEDSQTAYAKTEEQRSLFSESDSILAIGPLLRDAATDLVRGSKAVHMLIPGLAEIPVGPTPKTFVAFLSGRLSADAARIKQGHLGVAAFAHAHRKASENGMPDALRNQPKLMLRGVDFSHEATGDQVASSPEAELKEFSQEYAGRYINLQALPYTHDREKLYGEISMASVALMPSWHEGFGLVAWEAIAAGVPLIISKQSGVYRLLEEQFPGYGTGCVEAIDVQASNSKPFFQPGDLEAVSEALKQIAYKPEIARKKAGALRGVLINDYTWPNCAAQAVHAFGWALEKGSAPATVPMPPAPTPVSGQAIAEGLPISMPIKHWRAGVVVADSLLLRAEEERVSFVPARQPELNTLDAWLDDVQHLQAVRLLTGAGGIGKTRLALELCEQRLGANWVAGFLDSELDAHGLASGWQALRALERPLLIVIDYAETRQDALLTMIKAILLSPSAHPVRLLLLARDGGEWWNSLPGKNKICEPLLSSYATSGPYRLPSLHDSIEDRQQAYYQALHAFADDLGVSPPQVIPDLEGEHFGQPLYLQMAALLALRGERPTTAQGLTRALLNHERRYWRGLFFDHVLAEPERYAEQLMALTTLTGGFATPKAALPHWERANGKIFSSSQFAQLFHALIPLYPGKQGLQPMRPDLLGEALVAQALLRPSAVDLLDTVLGNGAGQGMRSNALTVLACLSDHYQELHEILIEALKLHFRHCWQELILVATETTSHLPVLVEAAFERLPVNIKDQVAGLLKSQIIEASVQLAQFNCLVSKFLLDKCHQKYLNSTNDTKTLNDYANRLNTHAITLVYAGRDNDALPYAQQALDICKRLARKDPDRFASNLAVSLNTYANRLSEAGRDDEALVSAEEALAINQRLTQKNPDHSATAHATSLLTFACRLSDVGRNDEAVVSAGEALAINQRLAQKNPDHFASDHAASLNNYATYLSEVGRDDEALEFIDEALVLYQQLAQKNPDRFAPDHAMSLHNYADCLGKAGRNDEALVSAGEALAIYQRLAQKNPDRFAPEHAMLLHNYAKYLIDAGRNDEALVSAGEALAIYQQLAQKNPVRIAKELFHTACDTHLLKWLSAEIDANYKFLELDNIPETVTAHRRPLLQLHACFVQACYATDQAYRSDLFKQVLAIWNGLSKTNRIEARQHWLCASAWSATHKATSIENSDWQAVWRQFRLQRHGHVPHWMLELALRLEFKWPA